MNVIRNWYIKSLGKRLRQYGLRYEDLFNESEPAVAMAIARLSPKEREERDKRLRRALDLDFKKTTLPEEIQAVQEPFKRTLWPLIDECMAEIDERKELTGTGPSRVSETYLKVFNDK